MDLVTIVMYRRYLKGVGLRMEGAGGIGWIEGGKSAHFECELGSL
jgi:hypothetical protein